MQGSASKNGVPVALPLNPTTPQEDSLPAPTGIPGYGANQDAHYGHRDEPGRPRLDEYSNPPAQPAFPPTPGLRQGCSYHGHDEPGWKTTQPPGAVLDIDLIFTGEVIDKCNSDVVKKTATWTVKGTWTVAP